LAQIPADVSEYIEATTANETYVGVIVGFIDGDETSVQSYGVASLETMQPPAVDTVFEIGSITKTFTATLLADAALQGELSLDDTVQSHAPDGITLAQVDDRPVTLADVATHRAGLPRLPPNMTSVDISDPYATYDTDLLWQAIDTLEPVRPPGTLAEYSNFGFGLLGTLVAGGGGAAYRELLNDRILAPLGMTGTDSVLTDALRARAATGYGADGRPSSYWSFDAIAGAGAINSTMTDMLVYLRANMTASDEAESSTLSRAMALAHVRRADFTADGSLGIGLAWISLPGGGGVWHNGGTAGFRTFIGFTDDGSRGVVILANSGGQGVDEIGYHLLKPSLPLPTVRQSISMAPELLEEYVSVYRITPEISFTVTQQDDTLYAQLTGQGPLPIQAAAPDRFFNTAVGADITFERGDENQITALILNQAGVSTRAERLGPDGEPVAPIEVSRLPAEALEDYLGDFQLAPGAILSVTRDGDRLLAQLTGQPAIEIYPEGTDRFIYTVVEAAIEFNRDDSGNVNSLTLHQNGAALPAALLKSD
jgi:CubicO group peptidase (beta-lactamase class C family)